MKIIELRLKNLNSLYGEWVIDFTDQEYISNGIFAITGPTGAGKSTILDAICLALYGETPRLKTLSKSTNEIMSRGQGECYAEVTFQSQSGTFRCHWSQHRARKSHTGRLADSKHEISNALTGEVLESKKGGVKLEVIKQTGMDIDRFTRSILLAQGGFTAFLKASADERAPILEQLTGSNIYSDISVNVHEKHKAKVEEYNLLQAETQGIITLSVDDETSLIIQRDELAKEEEALVKSESSIRESLSLIREIDTLKKDISVIEGELDDVSKESLVFDPKRITLKRANSAWELDGEYSALVERRKEQLLDENSIASIKLELPTLNETIKNSRLELVSKEEDLLALKAHLREELEIIKDVRSLDQNIIGKKEELSDVNDSLDDIQKELKIKSVKLKDFKSNKEELNKRFKDINHYIVTNAQDSTLLEDLSLIQSLNIDYTQLLDKIYFKDVEGNNKKEELEEISKKVKLAESDIGQIINEYNSIKDNRLALEQQLSDKLAGRAFSEYQKDLSSLNREESYINRIISLEEERSKLISGKPCPLCGSKSHPYIGSKTPKKNEIREKIDELEVYIEFVNELESQIKIVTDEEHIKFSLLTKKNGNIDLLKSQLDSTKDLLDRIDKDLKEVLEESLVVKDKFFVLLKKYGVKNSEVESLESIVPVLVSRGDQWRTVIREKESYEESNKKIEVDIILLENQINMLKDSLSIKNREQKTILAVLNQSLESRTLLYGDKVPDIEVLRLENNLSVSEKNYTLLKDKLSVLITRVSEENARLIDLEQRIIRRLILIESSQAVFSRKLEEFSFSTEKEFLEAKLSLNERKFLEKEAQVIDNKILELKAKLSDTRNKLSLNLTKPNSEKKLESLKDELLVVTDKLGNSRESLGGIKQLIESNLTAKESLGKKFLLLEKQKIEVDNWAKLHAIIGSADGKKYRNFAQGLTFEIMVTHANIQLSKMSDRYLLLRDLEKPLELNVIDNYQAGEIRSTKNLSGGESFIVSLALALGLSKMASKKVRVDSLFLDEGFGSLDDESLDSALETLSSLHGDGKLIGVISHVQALKDRISTQIIVTPKNGGRSVVTGPGCKEVNR